MMMASGILGQSRCWNESPGLISPGEHGQRGKANGRRCKNASCPTDGELVPNAQGLTETPTSTPFLFDGPSRPPLVGSFEELATTVQYLHKM